ncbi:MAG: PilZ domain-containing protein [Terriglobales bacterium]
MAAEHTSSVSTGLKMLETQHFDAIIFDYRADSSSDDFMSSLRQSAKYKPSLLIAVVDPNFSARPLFGLGANFVLFRPLSSERTRIGLRAARGLMQQDRRRAPRAPIATPVTVSIPGKPEMNVFLADLSDGGSLINSSNLPRACKVYFEFALSGHHQLVRLSGEVAWQDASGRTGIRFLDVPQSSRRIIQAWLQRNHVQTTVDAADQSPLDEASETETWVEVLPTPGATRKDVTRKDATQKDAAPKDVAPDSRNRRGGQRLECTLGAEVYHLGTGVPTRCVLTDLSEGGCYVQIVSPFARKSGVEILVRTADTKLVIRGQVLTAHPGFGMGVRFDYRDSAEREQVRRMLATLSVDSSLDEQPI